MNQASAPMVVVSQLSCVRGEQLIFDKLNFSLVSGEVLQIVGPNGIGKSSLLRIVAGLLSPASGNFSCQVDSFYLGHQLGLKRAFTIEENLIFDMRYPRPSFAKMTSLLDEMNLSHFLGQKTALLSQGQQQKLALIKCLLSSAALWILDEPLVALDITARELWQKKVIDHTHQGGAVMISSHLPLVLPQNIHKKLELLPC